MIPAPSGFGSDVFDYFELLELNIYRGGTYIRRKWGVHVAIGFCWLLYSSPHPRLVLATDQDCLACDPDIFLGGIGAPVSFYLFQDLFYGQCMD